MVLESRWADSTHRTREENLAAILARSVEHVVETAHVQLPGGLGFVLGDRREQSGELKDGFDIVAAQDIVELLRLPAVEVFVARRVEQMHGSRAQIGSDHALDAGLRTQGRHQRGTDLTGRAGYQNSFRRRPPVASLIMR